MEVRAESDVLRAVERADVVCCATNATTPLFPLEALKPDVHVNAVGSFRPTMRELPDELLADAGTVYVDKLDSALDEAGEIVHALGAGVVTEADLVEIGCGLRDGVVSRSGRTVFKSVGIASQDWATMRLLAERFPEV